MTGLLDAAGIVVDHVPDGWLEEDVLLLVTAGYPPTLLDALTATGLTPEATMLLLRTVHTLADHITPRQIDDLVQAQRSTHPGTPATTWVRDLLTTVPHPDATTLVDAPAPVVAAILVGHHTDGTVHLRALLAGDPHSTPQMLTTLAQDPHDWVRHVVAGNPSTPRATLTTLAWDADVAVRAGVARNRTTPPDMLTTLAQDPHDWVRHVVAGNPSTPPDVLTTLAGDPSGNVRWAAATNTSTPPAALTTLAVDADSGVRKNAAGRFTLAV